MWTWWWLVTLMLHASLHTSEAAVYYLNDSEYARMPPIFRMDAYEPCLLRAGGRYCSVSFDLVSDAPSELFTMIQEYSAHTLLYYNHTKLRYGICVTQACKQFLRDNTTLDLDATLEACLNETLWGEYKLKAKLNDQVTCNELDEQVELDVADISVAAMCVTLFLLNVVGSLYGFCCVGSRMNQVAGKSFLESFSIRNNWRKLVALTPESELHLIGLYGLKALTMVVVLGGHSTSPFPLATDNPRYFEQITSDNIMRVPYNMTMVVQTFFVMSGFLLMYNMLLDAEKHAVRWTMLPRRIMLRWLRLTPPLAVILAVTSTWLRFALPFHGPFWQVSIGQEVEHCRREWWRILLYINNYSEPDGPPCMMHTWYLAADIQLYVAGLAVYVLTSGLGRKLTLAVLFLAGVLFPAAHTYWQDLDAMVMFSPESARNLFFKDSTLRIVYKPGHTNLASYVLGLVFGLLVYHLHKTKFSLQTPGHKKYRYAFWATFPGILGLMVGASFFYRDPRAPLYARVLFAALHRPLYGALLGGIIIGMVIKLETVYRGILEWRGWVVPARLSFSAYLLHSTILRLFHGTRTTLLHTSFFSLVEENVVLVVMSFLVAIPYWLLVEAPINQLVKLGFSKKRPAVDAKTMGDDGYGIFKTDQVVTEIKITQQNY